MRNTRTTLHCNRNGGRRQGEEEKRRKGEEEKRRRGENEKRRKNDPLTSSPLLLFFRTDFSLH
jgi:hypothetical protein